MSTNTPAPSMAEIMEEEMKLKRQKEEEDMSLQFISNLELESKKTDSIESTNQKEFDDAEFARRLQAEEGLPELGSQYDDDMRLAMELQAQFDALDQGNQPVVEAPVPTNDSNLNKDAYDEDMLLAQRLQEEYNREYNHHLDVVEQRQNQGSSVGVSMANFRIGQAGWSESEHDDDDDDVDSDDAGELWDFTPRGVQTAKTPNGHLVSKHDVDTAAKRNTRRLEQIHGVDTGITGHGEFHIAPKAFNDLREFSHKLTDRGARIKGKEDRATNEQVLDPKTRLALQRMVNLSLLSEVTGVVSTGKEATIFHATGGSEAGVEELAVKIFKTTLNEFKNRADYIQDDHKFRDEMATKKTNTRGFIKMWTQKEATNLTRLCKAGIPCPTPMINKNNILVMTFIGKEQRPAPNLKEMEFSESQLRSCWLQCVSHMHTLFNVCHLIHGDYSEYNLLYWKKTVYVIDVGQGVDITHRNSLLFLFRDCSNMVTFFEGRGVDTPTALSLFRLVTDGGIIPSNRDKKRHMTEVEERLLTIDGETTELYPDVDYVDGVPCGDLLLEISQAGALRSSMWDDEEEAVDSPMTKAEITEEVQPLSSLIVDQSKIEIDASATEVSNQNVK